MMSGGVPPPGTLSATMAKSGVVCIDESFQPPLRDPPAKKVPAGDPPAREPHPPARDPPARDPPARDPPARDLPAQDPPAKAPSDLPAKDFPAKGVSLSPAMESRGSGETWDQADVARAANQIAVHKTKMKLMVAKEGQVEAPTEDEFHDSVEDLIKTLPNPAVLGPVPELQAKTEKITAELIGQRTHVKVQRDFYLLMMEESKALSQRLCQLGSRAHKHHMKVKEGTTAWTPEAVSAEGLAQSTAALFTKFNEESSKLMNELTTLSHRSLQEMMMEVRGSTLLDEARKVWLARQNGQVFALIDEHCKKSAELHSAEAEKALLMLSLKKLEDEEEEMKKRRETNKLSMQQIQDSKRAQLRSVLEDITNKKRTVAVALDPPVEGRDELLEDLGLKAERAFNETVAEQFRTQKPMQQNHFIVTFNEGVSQGNFAPYLKEGFKHLAWKRYHMGVAPGLMSEDAVTVIKFGSDTATVVLERQSWDEANNALMEDPPLFADGDLTPRRGQTQPFWKGCSEAFKLALNATEKHKAVQVTGHSTHIICLFSAKPETNGAQMETVHSYCKFINDTASNSNSPGERNRCSAISLLLGSDSSDGDFADLPMALNGYGDAKRDNDRSPQMIRLSKPGDMLHTFNSISQWMHTDPGSSLAWRMVSSVTEKYREMVKRKAQFNLERRKSRHDEAQKTLERLDKQGEVSKQRIDEVSRNISEFLSEEAKELEQLLHETSDELAKGRKVCMDMTSDIDAKALEVKRLGEEEALMRESSMTADIFNKYKDGKVAMLNKLFAFDEDHFHTASSQALKVWEKMSTCFRWRHNALRINLRELNQHVENLHAQYDVNLPPAILKNKVMWMYRQQGVLVDVKSTCDSQNWAKVVEFHIRELFAEEEDDRAVARHARVLAGHLPLQEVVDKPADSMKVLSSNLSCRTEFRELKRELTQAEQRTKKLKRKVGDVEDRLEDISRGVEQVDADTKAKLETKLKELQEYFDEGEVEEQAARSKMEEAVAKEYGEIMNLVGVVQKGVTSVKAGVFLAAGADEHVQKLSDLAEVFDAQGIGQSFTEAPLSIT